MGRGEGGGFRMGSMCILNFYKKKKKEKTKRLNFREVIHLVSERKEEPLERL